LRQQAEPAKLEQENLSFQQLGLGNESRPRLYAGLGRIHFSTLFNSFAIHFFFFSIFFSIFSE